MEQGGKWNVLQKEFSEREKNRVALSKREEIKEF